jgi:hypothetical protein
LVPAHARTSPSLYSEQELASISHGENG